MRRAPLLAFPVLLAGASQAQSPLLDFLRYAVPPDRTDTRALALEDLDLDGDLDVIGVNTTSGGNLVWLNQGSGLFLRSPGGLSAPSSGTPGDVALADFDADGDADVLVVSNGGASEVLANDGQAGFLFAASFPETTSVAASIRDFDGDGRADVLLVVPLLAGTTDLVLKTNQGGSGIAFGSSLVASLAFQASAVGAADVDGDGAIDLLIAGASTSALILNAGGGVFVDASTQLPPGVPGAAAVCFADVDDDGDEDVFLGSAGAVGPDALLLNDGSGVFVDGSAGIPIEAGVTTAIVFEDLDADGDLDAFQTNDDQPASLWAGDGTGAFTAVSGDDAVRPESVHAIVAGDLDGDGDADLFLGAGRQALGFFDQNRVFYNDGAGLFIDGTSFVPYRYDAFSVPITADFDGSGSIDVYLANRSGEADRLLLNDGTGNFQEKPGAHPGPDASAFGGFAFDAEGDGDEDLYLFEGTGSLLLNDGQAAFTSAPIPDAFPFAGDVGDVDGDGDADIFVSKVLSDRALLKNNGDGTFFDSTSSLPSDPDIFLVAKLGDLDRDGDLDILRSSFIWKNNGNGNFTRPNITPSDFFGRVLGDVDGDGDLDVVAGKEGVFRNMSSVSFNFSKITGGWPLSPNSIVDRLIDLDGDGDLDATAFGASGFVGCYSFRNDGSGNFSDDSSLFDLDASGSRLDVSLATGVADFDADGDLDLFLGHSGQDYTLTNRTRQVARNGLPRLGKRLELDVFGAPSTPFALAFAQDPASIPVGMFGTLRLDPASLFVLSSGSLDAQGRSKYGVNLPALPSLADITLYVQAIVGAPLRLTNLELVPLTTF